MSADARVITDEAIEQRRAELELEPHRLAWERMVRAVIDGADGSPPERAAVAEDVRSALRLVEDRDVRGSLARELEKLARKQGLEIRASEILRTLEQQERARRDGKEPADLQGTELGIREPEAWPDEIRGAELVASLVTIVERFVVLPPGGALTCALWVLHAAACDASAVSPILAISSPEKRCGKTTLLLVLRALVPKPITASNLTPAALFRAVEIYRPTLLLDEGDAFLTGRSAQEELIALLNSGHSRSGAHVIRTVGDNHETRLFSTWCPKAIALIGELPPTLADRSILILMRRRTPHESIERLRLDRLEAGELEPFGRQAWTWARANMEQLKRADPDVPAGLHDRAADNWRPLLAIADLIGSGWPARAREAIRALAGGQNEAETSAGVQLLADLEELFAARGIERLASAEIVAALVQREDRPWPEWRRGQPITARQVARLLRPFGIRPRQLWIDGENRQGYARADFDDALARYPLRFDPLEPLESNQQAAFPGIFDPLEPEPPRGSKNGETPHHDCDLGNLGDQTGGAGEVRPIWETKP